MKRLLLTLLCVLSLVCCSCTSDTPPELPDGARTIDGVYICDELQVGYYFSADGFGVQNIAGVPLQIRYYIIGNTIYIENFTSEDRPVTTFDFVEYDDYITIGGVKYLRTYDEDITKTSENAIDSAD